MGWFTYKLYAFTKLSKRSALLFSTRVRSSRCRQGRPVETKQRASSAMVPHASSPSGLDRRPEQRKQALNTYTPARTNCGCTVRLEWKSLIVRGEDNTTRARSTYIVAYCTVNTHTTVRYLRQQQQQARIRDARCGR